MSQDAPLAEIRTDGGTQLRASLNIELINDLAAGYEKDLETPDVVLFDDGDNKWLADGFHRVSARRKCQKATINAQILKGSLLDAILYAASANAQHDTSGLRRTKEDKEKAVTALLANPEWAKASDRWIAEKCKVAHSFVGDVRRRVGPTGVGSSSPGGDKEEKPTRRGRDNKQRGPRTPVTPRDPGVEEPESETATGGRNGHKPPKRGDIIFSWADHERLFGQLVRLKDNIGKAYHWHKGTNEELALDRLLREYWKLIVPLRKRLEKLKKNEDAAR